MMRDYMLSSVMWCLYYSGMCFGGYYVATMRVYGLLCWRLRRWKLLYWEMLRSSCVIGIGGVVYMI